MADLDRPVPFTLGDVMTSLRPYLSTDPSAVENTDMVADMSLGFMPGIGQAQAARDFERARQEGSGLGMGLAGLSAIPFAGGVVRPIRRGVKALKEAKPKPRVKYNRTQTVHNPERNAFPGIYKDPRQIVAEANARVAPEDPMLKRLWGVDRQEIYDIAGNRSGNMPGRIMGAAAKPKGAYSADMIMNRRNEQRLVNALGESLGTPIEKGMRGWYYMDPAYHRLVELVGPEQAMQEYNRLNMMTGIMSPGSDVLTEINRGTAARMLHGQGNIDDFFQYGGGISAEQRAAGMTRLPGAPELFDLIQGHPYHSTAHSKPLGKWLEHGRLMTKAPKVPLYTQASGVPQIGFQTDTMVPDAHWSRAVGLADVRRAEQFGGSASSSETQSLAPWWRNRIAAAHDMEAVPAQAVTWGLFSPQTGVDSPVGAGKLELLTKQIVRAAQREGVSPETMRDRVLLGKAMAGQIDPMLLGGMGAGGAAAAGLGSYLMDGRDE
jgi:hypothetical protein